MENITNTYPDELQHYGILGMQWGKRRFQNKDGSLTPEGKKRYDKDSDDETTTITMQVKKSDADKFKNAHKKSPNEMTGKDYKQMKPADMTDEELRRAIERSRMEKAYAELNPEPVSRGKEIVDKIIFDKLIPSAIDAGKNFMDKKLGKIIDEAMKDAKPESEYDKLKKKYDLEKLKKDLADLGKPKEESLQDAFNKYGKMGESIKKARDAGIPIDDDVVKNMTGVGLKSKKNDDTKTDSKSKNESKSESKSEPKTETKSESKSEPKTEPESKPKSEPKSESKPKDDDTVWSGKVEGKGTSTSSIKDEWANGKKWWDNSNVTETVWFESDYSDFVNNRTTQSYISSGQSYATAFLEDHSR